MKFPLHTLVTASSVIATSALGHVALADTVVQIPVDSVLDGRSVSTLTDGVVVPWIANQGVYNDGCCGAYATDAVKAQLAPTAAGEGLPDDGLFAATANLPPFQLHFSNAASATSPQTVQVHQTTGPQSFQFAVPQATYSALYLILTASEGTTNFTVTLSYAGGAAPTMTDIMLPDSGIGVQTGGSPHFYLITDTGKWSTTDMDVEATGHTIEGIQLTPSATDMLTGIQVTKTNSGHLVFWGATGIATSPVDAGASSSSDAESSQDSEAPSDATSSSGAETASGSPAGSTGAASGAASGESSGGSGSSGTAQSGTTTSTGTSSGASSQSGSGGSSSGSNGATPTPSNSSGCSFAPTSSPDVAWAICGAMGMLFGGRRRALRKTRR